MNLIRFLIFLSVLVLLNAYLFIRGRQALPDRMMVQSVYTVVFLFVSLSIFVALFAGNKLPVWLARVFEQTGGYWMVFFVFLLGFALIGDLLRIANHFLPFFPRWITVNYSLVKSLYLIIVLVVLGMISLVGFIRFSNPAVVDLELDTGNKVSRNGELTLVVASDLHLGHIVRKGRLVKWVDMINRQDPDIILLAGDIFDHSFRAVEAQGMNSDLARLKARYGVYCIPGNHDYYTGIDRVLEYLGKTGMNILRDTAVTVADRVIIVGRDDLTNPRRKPLASLVAGLNTGLPKIVIDHQPARLAESIENGIDVHLSGHTHNGQLFPFNRIVSLMYDLGYGYRKSGDTHQYVSSGLGLWGAPIRLGTQSEIVRIRLKGSSGT